MENVDIAIIGAGVVGLAIAWELSRHSSLTIAVLEQHPRFGQETSSRNSEVIHSGIYYPGHMLKTILCLEGKQLLYEFCDRYRVVNYHTGKLVVVPANHDADDLDDLRNQARLNQVGILPLTGEQIAVMEPAVSARSGLWVPSTGIIDSHNLMQALHYLAKENQVVFLFNTPLTGVYFDGQAYTVETPVEQIETPVLINASGLNAPYITRLLGMDPDQTGYRLYPCKGEYFKIHRRLPIRRLIYPLPGRTSLGIHLTVDAGGGMRLGPNAFYVDKIDYTVAEEHHREFYEAASTYLPALQAGDLFPDFAGIRPKLQSPDDPYVKDFIIREESAAGFPGLVNLIGIESPGLTSCLAIARYVKSLL